MLFPIASSSGPVGGMWIGGANGPALAKREVSAVQMLVVTAFYKFEALVQAYRPRVFRFLLVSLRDREFAENLTQDCFLRAYRARDQFRGASSPATWLMQIAINLVRKHESSNRLKF